jgi:PAS domain S-box-containing protein
MERAAEDGTAFISTFARQRNAMLRHADAVLSPVSASGLEGMPPETIPKLSQLLVSSLEELKVAEEELLEQHLATLSTRAELERTLAFYRALFDLAPCSLLLTTTDGTIRLANRAVSELLKRDVYFLEGKPLPAIIPREGRGEFRQQLSRVNQIGGVTNWRFTVERYAEAAVQVEAVVQPVPASVAGANALYWLIKSV